MFSAYKAAESIQDHLNEQVSYKYIGCISSSHQKCSFTKTISFHHNTMHIISRNRWKDIIYNSQSSHNVRAGCSWHCQKSRRNARYIPFRCLLLSNEWKKLMFLEFSKKHITTAQKKFLSSHTFMQFLPRPHSSTSCLITCFGSQFYFTELIPDKISHYVNK